MYQLTDYVSGQITTYKHDNNGRLQEYYVNAIGTTDGQSMFYNDYDDEGRITGQHYRKDYTKNGEWRVAEVSMAVTYGEDESVDRVGLTCGINTVYENSYQYDDFGRPTRKVTALSFPNTEPLSSYSITDAYTYEKVTGVTSGLITALASTFQNGAITRPIRMPTPIIRSAGSRR